MSEKMTGYPSIDKPWLKYYDKDIVDSQVPQMRMYDYLYECNKSNLHETAISYYGTRITFEEMFVRIDSVAMALKQHGVEAGEIVSVCMLTQPEVIFLFYAINKIGAISNMIGLTSSVEDLHNQIYDTDSKVVFTTTLAYEKIVEASKNTTVRNIIAIPIEFSMPFVKKQVMRFKSPHIHINDFSYEWKKFIGNVEGYKKNESGDNVRHIENGKDIAVIIYTGGSTGVPKGVQITNNSAVALANQYVITKGQIYDFRKGHKFLCIIPPFLAVGIFAGWHAALCCGVNVILRPDSEPAKFHEMVKKYKPNHVCCGPLHIDNLIKHKDIHDLSFFYSVIVGGEKITEDWYKHSSEALNNLGARNGLFNGYGMTEACGGVATGNCVTDGMITFPKTNIMILNENGDENQYNEIGEICISGPTIMNGYYGKTQETSEVIFYDKSGNKWLHSGDLGYVSKDGKLYITGRIKRLFWKKDSKNDAIVRIYPMRIEEILDSTNYVSKSAVIGVKDDLRGYKIVAFIKNKSDIRKNELEKLLNELSETKLPESHIPDEYIFVNEFPLTRAGKVDYRALEESAASINAPK